MIHELIDQRKRTFRSSTARSTKTVSDNNNIRNLTDHPNFEQSDNDNKEVDSLSTTFIPPWLRNSLGLNQRANQSHATSDPKSARTIPRYKEHSNNDFGNLKGNFDQVCSLESADHFENCLPKNCEVEIVLTHEPDAIQTSCNDCEKPVPTLWKNVPKDSEVNLNASPESKLVKEEESKLANTDIMTSHEIDKLRDEEKKRLRLTRQKTRIKRRAVNEEKPSEVGKEEVSLLLEMKAREVLHNYAKKNVHSSASDIKQLEAKLILLSAKCDKEDTSLLGPQELRLLQEINEQTRSKEDFEKLMAHIKETNLKEILRGPDGMTKVLEDKAKKFEESLKSRAEKEDRGMKDINVYNHNSKCNEDGNYSNLDKDSTVSTDDENDIKRFSQFLSKKKNVDEKRKCLEEVRNYFEKKRRTRMTKRRPMEESKIPKSVHFGDKKDDFGKEKVKYKDVSIVLNGKEKKLNEEVVEKAVNETLQKFVDLYHFHVSPSVLGTVKKNVLQAIQSDSLEINRSKQSLKNNEEDGGNSDVSKTDRVYSDKEGGFNYKENHKNQTSSYSDGENIVSGDPVGNYTIPEDKKRNLKRLLENLGCQTQKAVKENDIVENEHIKRLKREFETFLNSIQAHADITGLKLQSIILEREEQSSTSKNLQFVYNFSKKSLESNKPNQELGSSFVSDGKTLKTYKDTEAQTPEKSYVAKRSVKMQTCSIQSHCDRNLQTENASYTTSDVQTDDLGMVLQELRDLKGEDISTGLYRMISSREKGKFYLYPEDLDESRTQVVCNKSSASILQNYNCTTNTDVNEMSWNASYEEQISKEKNTVFKEKESKCRQNRRNNVRASSFSQKIAMKKENLTSDFENSLNCLFFRSSAIKTPDSVTKTNSMDEGLVFKGDTSKKDDHVKHVPQDNHLGCVWFWNGEKITPGCDLKIHVEDLLAEKLKEINSVDGPRNRLSGNSRGITKDECYEQDCSIGDSVSVGTNIELKNMFSYERDSSRALETPLLVFSEESECVGDGKKVEEDDSVQNVETLILDDAKNVEKRVKEVGTQHSQQTFLSLNITRLKPPSKTEFSGKPCKKKSKRKSFIVKPVRESQRSVINISKPSDVARAVRKLKKMKLKIEKVRSSDTTSSTASMANTSSSTSKNFSEDPLAVILGLRNNSNLDDPPVRDVKNKIGKIIGLVDHEVQTSNNCNVDRDYCVRKTSKPSKNSKHWELIESVLNRISKNERESLWSDIRDFIKKKIGRDINDEGAREVCIEIEQDMPKSKKGRRKHAVFARGHYKRNEGDVEVEIDLTLDDLEMILCHRQKKSRRRQWSSTSRSRKLISSSSGHSNFRKMISSWTSIGWLRTWT